MQTPLFYDSCPFREVNDGDPMARAMVDRHYSRIWRGKPGTKRFIGPGVKMVLVGVNGDWIFTWRRSIFRKDGQTGVECTVFRNEGSIRSSEIILWAEAAWDAKYGAERKFTYVNPRLIRSTNPGYCFRVAGYARVHRRTHRRLILLAKEIVS